MSLSVCQPVAKVKHKSERVLRVLSSHSVKCRISLSRRSRQVEGRMRMQTKKQQQKNQSKFERYFTCYPGQDWAENPICGLRNVCVCVLMCVHELMLLHTRRYPGHLPLKPKGLCHLFFFPLFCYKSNR